MVSRLGGIKKNLTNIFSSEQVSAFIRIESLPVETLYDGQKKELPTPFFLYKKNQEKELKRKTTKHK